MRKTVVFIIVIVAIVALYFWQPFGQLEDLNRARKVPRPETDENIVNILKEYITANHQTPEDYVITAFQDHDIIFLGEVWKIKQNLQLLNRLIPLLYKNGIKELGVEFALNRDQDMIDDLLTGSYYNESKTNIILFNYLVIWGFREYADVFKAAWEFNQTLQAGEEPFRIIGLAVKQEYHHIKFLKDIDDPEILKKVYANGIPDAFSAEVIKREFIDTNRKALVYSHIHTGFTRFKYEEYQLRAKHMGFEDVKKTGQIVYDMIGEKAMTIYIHAPFPSTTSQTGLNYPMGGVIDTVMDILPEEYIPAGFSVAGNPFGELEIKAKAYTTGYEKLTLDDFCDGYILLAPLKDLEAVHPIPNFINEKNIKSAIYNFVGPKDRDLTVKDLSNFINDDAKGMNKVLEQFE